MTGSHHHQRTLGVRDMTLFAVSVILLLDTLAVPGTGFDVPVVIGSVLSIILGEIAIFHAERQRQKDQRCETG